MYTFASLAMLLAAYAAMRAFEVLGAGRDARLYMTVVRVLAVLVVVLAMGVMVALVIDAQTLAPAVRSAREVLAPLTD